MKEQFVTYDIALKLKGLGFNEECLCTYGKSDKRFMRNPGTNMIDEPVEDNPYYWQNSKVHESVICAPLWQQVIDWFREKYNINISVNSMGEDWNEFYLTQIKPFKSLSIPSACETYTKAREQAILKALTLIK